MPGLETCATRSAGLSLAAFANAFFPFTRLLRHELSHLRLLKVLSALSAFDTGNVDVRDQ